MDTACSLNGCGQPVTCAICARICVLMAAASSCPRVLGGRLTGRFFSWLSPVLLVYMSKNYRYWQPNFQSSIRILKAMIDRSTRLA